MRKSLPLVAAVIIAAVPVVASSTVASAAPAARNGRIVATVTWSRNHRAEIVRVTKNPEHRRVQASGVCRKPFQLEGVRWLRPETGGVLYGRGVTRVSCPHGRWLTAGYYTGWDTHQRYHRERGGKSWLG